MANIKSAIKRVQVAERNRLRNKYYKSTVRTFMKKFFLAVDAYASNPSNEGLQAIHEQKSIAFSKIDKAVKRGAFHANNGARKKSRLDAYFKRSTAAAS
ncbi:MAG: 30S ribosomal protein S20 [Cyanobacteria bacterium]|nr:30S ribosomal protein S20 [Cyanobacteriota bacterium]